MAEQKYSMWIEADDYEWLQTYDDGDINIAVTEEQAEEIIEKLERFGETEINQ